MPGPSLRGLLGAVHLLGVRGQRGKAPAPLPAAGDRPKVSKPVVHDFSHLCDAAPAPAVDPKRPQQRSSTATVIEHLSGAANPTGRTRADTLQSWDASHARVQGQDAGSWDATAQRIGAARR